MKKIRDQLLLRLVGALRRKALLELARPLPQAAFTATVFYLASMVYKGRFDFLGLFLASLGTLVIHVALYKEDPDD